MYILVGLQISSSNTTSPNVFQYKSNADAEPINGIRNSQFARKIFIAASRMQSA